MLARLQVDSPADYQLVNQEYVTEEEIRERPDEVYEAEEDYHGKGEDELTFLRGAIIRNVEQDLNHVGWYICYIQLKLSYDKFLNLVPAKK